MDEFTDENIQLSFESDDDSRIILTMAKLDGEKISMSEFVMHMEMYLHEVATAQAERVKLSAKLQ